MSSIPEIWTLVELARLSLVVFTHRSFPHALLRLDEIYTNVSFRTLDTGRDSQIIIDAVNELFLNSHHQPGTGFQCWTHAHAQREGKCLPEERRDEEKPRKIDTELLKKINDLRQWVG